MNLFFLMQLAIYEILDVVPFVILAAIPFHDKMRSKRSIIFFTILLYVLGFARRYISYVFPSSSAVFSLIWAVLYLAAYYAVIREPLFKLLFVLITVLNYASIMAIGYSYIGYHLFPVQISQNPYCLEASLSILMLLAVTYPVFFYWLLFKLRPLINCKVNETIWATLWLVPATFCVFFYYNIYTSENILSYSGSRHNLIFTLVISAGSFFVIFLVLRLVETSLRNAYLISEKHQLELHNLQYQHLADRIREDREARHDLRQLIAVLQVYLNNGDTENLRSYLQAICSSFPLDTPITICPHPALNALISYYCELVRKQEISFHVQADCPETIGIEDTDLVVLFGNLLENAAEACVRQKNGIRFITLTVQMKEKQLVLAIDNSFDGECRINGDSFYSSKRLGYGIGIASVRRIAGKYHGTARFCVKEQVFSASVILNAEGD